MGKVGNEDVLRVKILISILHDPQLVDPQVFETILLEIFELMDKESIHGYFPSWFNVDIREMSIPHSCAEGLGFWVGFGVGEAGTEIFCKPMTVWCFKPENECSSLFEEQNPYSSQDANLSRC